MVNGEDFSPSITSRCLTLNGEMRASQLCHVNAKLSAARILKMLDSVLIVASHGSSEQPRGSLGKSLGASPRTTLWRRLPRYGYRARCGAGLCIR